MKRVFASFILIASIGCQDQPKQGTHPASQAIDTSITNDTSLSSLLKNDVEKPRKTVDQIIHEVVVDVMMDTAGLHLAPIKVTSASLYKGQYSSYKNIRLSYKNVSDKRIEAIKFKWYGIDAFGEPADMGSSSFVVGFGGGLTNDPLNAGKSTSGSWSIMSKSAKKVVLAWPYEVAFSDGGVWKLKQSL